MGVPNVPAAAEFGNLRDLRARAERAEEELGRAQRRCAALEEEVREQHEERLALRNDVR